MQSFYLSAFILLYLHCKCLWNPLFCSAKKEKRKPCTQTCEESCISIGRKKQEAEQGHYFLWLNAILHSCFMRHVALSFILNSPIFKADLKAMFPLCCQALPWLVKPARERATARSTQLYPVELISRINKFQYSGLSQMVKLTYSLCAIQKQIIDWIYNIRAAVVNKRLGKPCLT